MKRNRTIGCGNSRSQHCNLSKTMRSDTPLDYAAFQLSPRRSRCELFVSSGGNAEKLASGLVKPFVTHLKVVEEQVALQLQSVTLKVDRHKNVESWFTKGTLERVVRFVSTPEVLESVSTFDAEMSQLEAAHKIYSHGSSDQLSSTLGGGRSSSATGADATKNELLRAIDVRLAAVKQDLTSACARAQAAGFNHDTVADLQLFAEGFGASRLKQACSTFVLLYDRHPELFKNPSWKSGVGDQAIRSSYSSDMSIDDNPPTAAAEQPAKPPTSSPPPKSLSSFASFPLRGTPTSLEPSVPTDETVSVKDKEKKEEGGGDPLPQTAAQPSSRRLSVQDRINLFENKQKEVGSATGSGTKPFVTKPELRGLSSDVSHSHSAAPAAVLRRWSGASDISIDLSGDKKEDQKDIPASVEIEVQKAQPCSKDQAGGSSNRSEEVAPTKVATSSGTQLTVSSSVKSEGSLGSNQLTSTLEKTRPLTSLTKSEDDSLESPVKPHAQINFFRGGKEERLGRSDQVKPDPLTVGASEQGAAAGSIEESDPVAMTLRAPSRKAELNLGHRGPGSGSKFQEAFAASQQRLFEVGLLRSHPRLNSSAESEEVEKKELISAEEQFGKSGPQKLKFQTQVQKDDGSNVYGTPPSSKFVQGGSGSMPMGASTKQAHRSRQWKGNQELNEELQMKANELEKLFAEHKLRVPEDQPNLMRRSKASVMEADQATSLPYRKQVADLVPTQAPEQKVALESQVLVTEVDGQNHDYLLQRSFSEVGLCDESRGKLYDSYMKKRDARLRELWDSNRAEKEDRMKAMHDSLERNSAEMKTKLSSSAGGRNSASSARRRAERLRSFNALRDEPLDFGQLQGDEDLSEFSELKPSGVGVSRNIQGKKPSPVDNSSKSTPRTPAAGIQRSATKAASSSGRRRTQYDNPLAQSVPSFSDLRKENSKPYSAASKAAARSQMRNYTHSRSTNEEMPSFKEEKSRRSQSLSKSSLTLPESSEGVTLTQSKFDKEHSEGAQMKFLKNVEPRRFLRKNNGIGPGAGSAIAKVKASMASEAMNNEEEYDKLALEPNVKDGEEEVDTMETEDQAVVDGAESRMSPESERLINTESENGDTSQSFTQMDCTLGAELPATVTCTLPVQDSPGESPLSWNSHTHYPFSYTHEASDVDASADSPVRSPASWNLHAFNPTEADATRMRKKWGSAQKPTLVTNASGVQSRKDMTKGFKRLLKFGRKSRGTESLADWISATTSEGDDDTEDGRDPANRSSEDLRKSRMGYHDGDFYNDQASSIPAPPANFRLREDHLSGSSMKAPRSFFSLSSFRSKGSDSKPR